MAAGPIDAALLQRAGRVRARFADRTAPDPWCLVHIPRQTLHLIDRRAVQRSWPVSTSRHGVGGRQDSYRTPAGAHRIAERIGAGAALHTIFRQRRATAERAAVPPPAEPAGADLVTTRILWLAGLEPGRNQGDGCDSYRRHIYIHGTDQEAQLGTPASIGCVRMRASDVAQLFTVVRDRTFVLILP